MSRIANSCILGAFLAAPVLAAPTYPYITKVELKPNPSTLSSGKAPAVEVTMTVHMAVKSGDSSCELSIHFNDGSPTIKQMVSNNWPRGAQQTTAVIRHTYTKAGTFNAGASGIGPQGCGRGISMQTIVKAPPPPPSERAPASKAEPKDMTAKKAARMNDGK